MLVTDLQKRPRPTNPNPAYLEPITDPLFGTKVTRITDPGSPVLEGEWEDRSRHGYSIRQPWNADGSLLYLDFGYSGVGDIFLDGRTYKPLFARKQPGSDRRWHHTDPHLRLCVGGNEIVYFNVMTEAKEVLASFSDYKDLRLNKGNPSIGGTEIAISANGGNVGFVFDLLTRQKGADVDLSGIELSWIGVSPLLNYIIVQREGDFFAVHDMEGEMLWESELYGMPSHYDLTVFDGEEWAVGVAKTGDPDGRFFNGAVIKRRLSDGKMVPLTNSGWASHTSCRSTADFAICSFNDEPNYPPYNLEVCAVPLDGSMNVKRLFSTHREYNGYYDETHPCPSPDGRRVIWASNWDVKDGPIAGYVTDIVDDTPPPPAGEPVDLNWRLAWDPIEGAQAYEIRVLGKGAEMDLPEGHSISETRVPLSEVLPEKSEGDYELSVRQVDEAGRTSVWSDPVVASIAGPAVPQNLRLEPPAD